MWALATALLFFAPDTLNDSLKAKLEEIYQVATQWGVGENKEKVPEARKELASYGKVALDFLFSEKIKTLKTLDLRAILAVVKANREEATPYLLDALENENDTIRRAALWLCAKVKDSAAVPTLLDLLAQEKRPRMIARILYTLGEIRDTVAVSRILPYLHHEDEKVRVRAASALRNMPLPRLLETYGEMLRAPNMQIRMQAVQAISRLPGDVIPEILAHLERETGFQSARLWIRALAEMFRRQSGDSLEPWKPQCRKALFPYLEASEPVVRAYTVQALAAIGGESVRRRLQDLYETEDHPLVRTVSEEALHTPSSTP